MPMTGEFIFLIPLTVMALTLMYERHLKRFQGKRLPFWERCGRRMIYQKQNRLIRHSTVSVQKQAVGLSCHNYEALKVAVDDPWVDVILARINPFRAHMDGSPAEINALLERARNNGKGIIGMKIFGNGDRVLETEREESITFALKKSSIHCMTLGMESIDQV